LTFMQTTPTTTRWLLGASLATIAAIGCAPTLAERSLHVMIQVESDVGVALACARILRDNHELGVTRKTAPCA
jgi:hypothetical protein